MIFTTHLASSLKLKAKGGRKAAPADFTLKVTVPLAAIQTLVPPDECTTEKLETALIALFVHRWGHLDKFTNDIIAYVNCTFDILHLLD